MPDGITIVGPAMGYHQIAAGGQVVGFGYGSLTGGNHHALLWTPSATSGIDLNPSGFTGFDSVAP